MYLPGFDWPCGLASGAAAESRKLQREALFGPIEDELPDAPGAAAGQAVARALATDTRPTLLLWADSDPVLPLESAGRAAEELFPNADGLTVVENAGHFLQEDGGEHIGSLIADWLNTR